MQLTLDQKQQLIWKVLTRRWPRLFRLTNRVPLAIGISEQIISEIPGIDRRALSRVLARYTKSVGYQVALSRGGDRENLDGTIYGPVSDEHKEVAKTFAEALKNQRNARRGMG